jgi:transcriptional regulator with XRE-family HTH domain
MTSGDKKHAISDLDRETIKQIATKAKSLRKELGFSYEEFAAHAKINRNTYFKFEKSATTGENFTIAILLKVIRGLNQSFQSFFQDL